MAEQNARILVVEGNPPELALPMKKATRATTAEVYSAALKDLSPGAEIDIAEPYFSDHDLSAIDFASYDGVAVTGSGVMWSAMDERARPFWALYEAAFAAGAPVFGSCWGLQIGAVVLGGEAKPGPNGVEAGFARGVTATDHPMHQGRRAAFDVIAMHRDDVTRPPEGAEITASNAHTRVQAMVYEAGGTSFWGVQYHPECTLRDVAFWFSKRSGPGADLDRSRTGHDIAQIAADPVAQARLCAKHRIGIDILDRGFHLTELRNWLAVKVAAV